MRRFALRVGGTVVLTLAFVAGGGVSIAWGDLVLYPTKTTQHHVMMLPGGASKPGQTYGYWGKFTGTRPGSYRASCIWLADPYWPSSSKHKQDPRFTCTIVLNFPPVPTPAGSRFDGLVIQGAVRRPPNNGELFSFPSYRDLPITGGSGSYVGMQGHADIKDPYTISVTFGT